MSTQLAKIISIKASNVGVIGVFEYVFSPEGGKLIFKGGNAQGKSTGQDTLKLATGGTTVLNRDYKESEKLFINAFIADGDNRIAVTVKSGKNGLYYVLKGYNSEKKPIGEIDGVKLTAGTYLKMLYDPIITKVADFCSEDRTRARNCHTELFADKLGKIEINQLVKDLKTAQDDMQYKERLRNTVADGYRGTDEFLKTKGVDWKRPDTHPLKEFDNLDSKKIELLAEQSRLKSAPKQERLDKMNSLENEMKLIAEKAINYNAGIEAKEKDKQEKKDAFTTEKEIALDNFQTIENVLISLRDDRKAFDEVGFQTIYANLKSETQEFFDSEFKPDPISSKIQYLDDGGRLDVSKVDNLTNEAKILLTELLNKRLAWSAIKDSESNPKTPIETPEVDQQLKDLAIKITAQTEQKGLRKALDSFFNWQDARDKVTELKAKIAEKYAAINTGIEGLEFKYDDEVNKTDMYYDGAGFDFFKTMHGKPKRVTQLSETERALLCLMVQFKRMSERAKSINLTYIDCSITKESYKCIEQALAKYGLKDVYVVASQACDVTANQLNDCDVLIEGGEVFFNAQKETKKPMTESIRKAKEEAKTSTSTETKSIEPKY